MIFRRFRYIAIFYLALILVITGLGIYVAFNTYFWLTSFWLFAVDIILIVVFIRFIEREHKKLAHFLYSTDQDDFTPPLSKEFHDLELNKAFEHLSNVIVNLREKAQINLNYLQTVINNINIAIICLDDSNKIILSNSAAKNLFDKSVLRDVNSLKELKTTLPELMLSLQANEKKLIKFKQDGKLQNYSVQLANFKIKGDQYKIFSFQNIQSELEQNELESWQKLTRVMTHEIMNSVIPISNLSGLVYQKMFDENERWINEIEDPDKLDIKEGLQTIGSRSKGLVSFVEATRHFTKMPEPKFELLKVSNLIKHATALLKGKLEEKSIELITEINDEELEIFADESLVSQVLINLLLNAIDAVDQSDKPQIHINAYLYSDNRTRIEIYDNGKGIAEKDLDHIFIPFYTTRKKGSGIGLSLAKQIMFLHKGQIDVDSEQGKGTKFVISF